MKKITFEYQTTREGLEDLHYGLHNVLGFVSEIDLDPEQEAALRRLKSRTQQVLSEPEEQEPEQVGEKLTVLDRRASGGGQGDYVTDPVPHLTVVWSYAHSIYSNPKTWVKSRRGELEWTKDSDDLPVSPRAVEYWIQGERTPSVESMVAVDAFLNDTQNFPVVQTLNYFEDVEPYLFGEVTEKLESGVTQVQLSNRSGVPLRRLREWYNGDGTLGFLEQAALHEACYEVEAVK